MSCGVCGAPAAPPFQVPRAELAPDLDLRPGEPARASLPLWVRTCRRCAAAAPDLSLLEPEAKAEVGSAAYRALSDEPPGTLAFRRWARLCPPTERHEALLWAAWAADDAGDIDAARVLRRAALAEWPATGDPRRIDVLRRAGLLAEARDACDAADPADAVVAFQRARIKAGDILPHLLSSALRPPARTPHVAHVQPRPRSWWRRG